MLITDQPAAYPQRYTVPTLSFLPPRSFTLFDPVGGSADPNNATELPFKLGSAHGWLNLTAANGVEIDEVFFQHQAQDVSGGRTPDGAATFAAYSVPTPGLPNATDLNGQADIIASLRISALMFNPPAGSDYEFLHLTNIGPRPVGLAGLRFNNGITLDLPDHTLAPGEIIALANHLPTYNVAYPDSPPAIAEYSGNLSNGGERVRLEIASLEAGVLDFEYKDGWHPSTDGGGDYLEIVDLDASRSSWSDRSSWRASSLAGPGGFDTWALDVFGTDNPLVASPTADPEADNIPNILEYALGLDPLDTDPDKLPKPTGNPLVFEVEFTRNTDATDVELVAEISFDGLTWFSGSAFTTETVIRTDNGIQTIRVRSLTPTANAHRQLIRLSATVR
ncbi:MAG: hypothetical protein P8J87_19180, partial [Verrucomicrobiales bacterium]|nr:hypothetical protein [Verrucomicrobiales bacterium]